jgi:hypothetical protein
MIGPSRTIHIDRKVSKAIRAQFTLFTQSSSLFYTVAIQPCSKMEMSRLRTSQDSLADEALTERFIHQSHPELIPGGEDERHGFLTGRPQKGAVLSNKPCWPAHWRKPTLRRAMPYLLGIAALIFIFVIIEILATSPWMHGFETRNGALRELLGTRAPYPIPEAYRNSSQLDINQCSTVPTPEDVPKNCELVHLQRIVRHGTRTPTKGVIAALSNLEDELRKHRHHSWPEWLFNWRNPYQVDKAGSLVEQGTQDMILLAKRDLCRYGRWMNTALSMDPDNAEDGGAEARHQLAWYGSSEKTR